MRSTRSYLTLQQFRGRRTLYTTVTGPDLLIVLNSDFNNNIRVPGNFYFYSKRVCPSRRPFIGGRLCVDAVFFRWLPESAMVRHVATSPKSAASVSWKGPGIFIARNDGRVDEVEWMPAPIPPRSTYHGDSILGTPSGEPTHISHSPQKRQSIQPSKSDYTIHKLQFEVY